MSERTATVAAVTAGKLPATRLVTVVFLDEAESQTYTLTEQEYVAIGCPMQGQRLSAAELAALSNAKSCTAVLDRAMQILSFGENNAKTLYGKLVRRGFAPNEAAYAVSEMQKRGYIDEDSQIARYILQCAEKKGWGPRRILPFLLQKGYDRGAVTAKLRELTESGELDFAERRRVLISAMKEKGASPVTVRAELYKRGF